MILSLGKVTKNMLIPLFIPIIYYIRHYILEKLNNDNKTKVSVFLNTFIASLSYSINIILLIIENKLKKSKIRKSKKKNFKNQLLIEKRKITIHKERKIIILLILISLFNFFNLQIYDLIKVFKPDGYKQYYFYSISITVFFLSTGFLSYLILGTKIYKHQKLSMIISPILSIVMFSVFIKDLGFELKIIIYLFICLFIRNFRFILMVFGKRIMEKYYISKFKLQTFLGIFGIIFSLLLNFISYYLEFNFIDVKEKKEFNGQKFVNIFDFWEDMNKGYFLLTIFLFFIENSLKWFCISFFSPNHCLIFINISSILIILKDLYIEKGLDYRILISFLALFGNMICGLIFNEIIIMNICNLNKNTAVELDKRQQEEYDKNNIDNLDNETRNAFSEISDTSIKTGNNNTNGNDDLVLFIS